MQTNYRLVVKTNKGYTKLAGSDCHSTKSVAGRLFQQKNVQAVGVFDIKGNHYLYLVKGQPSKTENVPSRLALYG